MTPPLIALEEHYYSEAIYSNINAQFRQRLDAVPHLKDRLLDLEGDRVASMDEGGVALQVVSHAFTPGGPSIDSCERGNDELAAGIAKTLLVHPGRLAGFAVLPVSDPVASAKELERCVKQHGFVGALIDNNIGGLHFDSSECDVMWQQAQSLDVPVYLHPAWPTDEQLSQLFSGNYSPMTAGNLGTVSWGWHSDTGLHILKLFAAGVFDRFPRLKIIIGHMGEMLPFMLERCIKYSTELGGMGEHSRSLREVWNENIWITTSGVWSLAPLKCLLENTKIERIMYSVDYPFESNEVGLVWFRNLEASGLLSSVELEQIAFKNAENLLKIKLR